MVIKTTSVRSDFRSPSKLPMILTPTVILNTVPNEPWPMASRTWIALQTLKTHAFLQRGFAQNESGTRVPTFGIRIGPSCGTASGDRSSSVGTIFV